MSARAPLSLQQEWLWRISKTCPDWSSVLGYAYSISGQLDTAVLQDAFNQTVSRHPSLLTAINDVNGIPEQRIDDSKSLRIKIVRVSGDTPTDIDANARHLLQDFREQVFSQECWPLFRATLLALSDRQWILTLAIHRIIGDCYAVDIVLRDLWREYSRISGNSPAVPIDGPARYYDYAALQRQTHDQWLNKHSGFWQQRLEQARTLRWPYDRVAAPVKQGSVRSMRQSLGSELSAKLRDSARRTRSLLPAVMLAIYVSVLAKWCHQTDFVVPFNVAGRQLGNKDIVGYFSYVLYLRIRLTGSETYKQLLASVSNEFFQALNHQDFGLMATQRPDLLTGNYFQWLTWDEADPSDSAFESERQLTGLTIQRVEVQEFWEGLTALPPGMVDVEVTFVDAPEGIEARGVYRADHFSSQTMDRFLLELQMAAEHFLNNPTAKFNDA